MKFNPVSLLPGCLRFQQRIYGIINAFLPTNIFLDLQIVSSEARIDREQRSKVLREFTDVREADQDVWQCTRTVYMLHCLSGCEASCGDEVSFLPFIHGGWYVQSAHVCQSNIADVAVKRRDCLPQSMS